MQNKIKSFYGHKRISIFEIGNPIIFIPIFFLLIFLCSVCTAQEPKTTVVKDSSGISNKSIAREIVSMKDSAVKKPHSPRTAAIRSAILPGLGQIYNKKYWKLPLVYGALGVTGFIFFDNIKVYKESKFAYAARIKAEPPLRDSTDYNKLETKYKLYSTGSIRNQRDKFRQYIDYSVLFFVFFWGLNVIDASVDAHLKSFDVSPNLSLKLKAGYSEMAKTNGISLVMNIHPKLPSVPARAGLKGLK
jgi:Family of unknown function (DUF5683)